jgi:hypothetical protein
VATATDPNVLASLERTLGLGRPPKPQRKGLTPLVPSQAQVRAWQTIIVGPELPKLVC